MKVEDSGEARLLRLGLQQQFKREFTLLTNFGISFSIISVLTGIGGAGTWCRILLWQPLHRRLV